MSLCPLDFKALAEEYGCEEESVFEYVTHSEEPVVDVDEDEEDLLTTMMPTNATFLSGSIFDPTRFQMMMKSYVEAIDGQSMIMIPDCILKDFIPDNTLPLPEEMKTIVQYDVYHNEKSYHGLTNCILVGTCCLHHDRFGPVYVARVSWGRWQEHVGFVREQDSHKLLDAILADLKACLPYETKAFPKDAVEWASRAMRFFSPLVKERLNNHRVSQQMGVILAGPPGTGKTIFVRYLEEVLDLECEHYSPAELINAAKRGRALRDEGLVVLDDVEELLIERSDGESTNVLPWLLSQTDARDMSVRRLLVMVTNHSEKLDDALKRPGRFDSILRFEPPDRERIMAALVFHMADDYDKDTAENVCDKLMKSKVQTLAHVSYLARMVYSGFVESWEEALDCFKEFSAYEGRKHGAKKGESMGFGSH